MLKSVQSVENRLKTINKLEVSQRSMKRAVFDISLKRKTTNTNIITISQI